MPGAAADGQIPTAMENAYRLLGKGAVMLKQVMPAIVFIGVLWIEMESSSSIYRKYSELCGQRLFCPDIAQDLSILGILNFISAFGISALVYMFLKSRESVRK